MLGTLVNTGAVLAGSLIGMSIHSRMPQRMVNIVFQGIGLVTLGIGISMSLRSGNILLAVVSVVVGAIIGEWLGIDRGLEKLSALLQRKSGRGRSDTVACSDTGKAVGVACADREGIDSTAAKDEMVADGMTAVDKDSSNCTTVDDKGRNGSVEINATAAGGIGCRVESDNVTTFATAVAQKEASARFTEGFITASMLFCVGSMSILGAIEDGTGQTPNLFFTKSIMDGISAIALASSFGIAIMFSSVTVLVYQGALTIFAGFMMRYMSEAMVADMTAVGGILLIGLGVNILKIKEINVVNMLPALVVAVVLSCFWPA